MTNEELQTLYTQVNEITTKLGIKHNGTEICDKLENVLTEIRKEYRKNNPSLYMAEIVEELEKMKNLRMFTVKYLGPTNNRGSRLKITDNRFGTSVVLNNSYQFDDILDQAKQFLKSKGIELSACSWDEKTKVDYLFTENFTDQIKGL